MLGTGGNMATQTIGTPHGAEQLSTSCTDVLGFSAQRASFKVERGPGQQRSGNPDSLSL